MASLRQWSCSPIMEPCGFVCWIFKEIWRHFQAPAVSTENFHCVQTELVREVFNNKNVQNRTPNAICYKVFGQNAHGEWYKTLVYKVLAKLTSYYQCRHLEAWRRQINPIHGSSSTLLPVYSLYSAQVHCSHNFCYISGWSPPQFWNSEGPADYSILGRVQAFS